MSITLYYFSGTGNSLHAARELQKRIPSIELIPIIQELKKIEHGEHIKSPGIVGFIFPCHGLTLPIPVKKFLRKVDLSPSDYIFAVTTRGSSVYRGYRLMNRLLRKQGKQLDASFVIDMANNNPKLKEFEDPSEEEINKFEEGLQNKLDHILDIVSEKKSWHDDTSGISFTKNNSVNYVMERSLTFLVERLKKGPNNYFYTDGKCNSCGVCSEVCLSGKIRMIDGRPEWKKEKDCYMCYACLNFCPMRSIQIKDKIYMKSHTPEKGRYNHPEVNIKDIAGQKGNGKA